MKKGSILVLFLLLAGKGLQAQAPAEDTSRNFYYSASAMGVATSGGQVPFWMRSNQYGSIPLEGVSGTLAGNVYRDYKPDTKPGRVDWGIGLDGRLNMGNRVRFILVEAYAKARWQIFQVKAGRSRDIMGLVDTNLSSGAFAISGNALGIPKLDLSITDYWNVPLTRGVFAIKGNFAMGYVGSIATEQNKYMPGVEARTWYHQKSLYGRLGKEQWVVNLYGGFNHQVFWGDENRYFNEWNLSPLATTVKAITGGVHEGSKVGNHLGSIDQGVEVKLNKIILKGYHQFFFDVGGLYHLNNIKDGLWGLSVNNREEAPTKKIGWEKVLIELLYTKSQGGEPDAKLTPSGDENYYNGMYVEGWTYNQENLGSPLLTNRRYMRASLPDGTIKDYIVNNRVVAFHAGLMGYVERWAFMAKGTFSMNYGTYGSSPWGHSGGDIRNPGPPPYFQKVNQLSGYLEASRSLKKGYSIGFVLAADYGDLLYNSIGGMIRLSRKW